MILPPLLAAFWLTLPHGDTAWDLFDTTMPFTITDRPNTGGVFAGASTRIGVDGSAWPTTAYRLGGADVTDLARGGLPLILPDLSFLAGLRVTSAAAPVTHSSPGPVVRLDPIVPQARWTATASLAFAPRALQSAGPSSPAALARLRWLTREEATGGGPVSSGTRLTIAAALTQSRHMERDTGPELPGDVLSLFARGSTDGRSGLVEAAGWLQRTRTAFAGRARLADRATSASQRYAGVTGRWTHAGRAGLEVTALLASTGIAPDAQAVTGAGTVDRLVDGPVPVLASLTDESHGRWSVGASTTASSFARHRIQAGGGASGAWMRARPYGSRTIGETVGGMPARVWEYGYIGESRRGELSVAGYVSDTIAIARPWTLDAGLRLEHVRGSAAGSRSEISWTSIEPRIAVAFTHGGWRVDGTVRRSYAPLLLDWLAFGDPAGPTGSVFAWTDTNADGRPAAPEVGALIALAGPGGAAPGFSAIAPDIHRPYTDEAVVSIERRLGSQWTVRFDGIARRSRDLPAALNVGVPPSAYAVDYVFDPGLDLLGSQDDQRLPIYSRPPSTFGRDRYLLTNGSASWTSDALHLSLFSSGVGRWSLVAAATAMRSRGPAGYRGFHADENDPLVAGEVFSDPNATTFAEGRLFFDRAYAAKVAGSYRAPFGLGLAAVARYADGQPFSRLVLLPNVPQGPDVVRAFANGDTRFTYTMTVDARVDRTLRLRARRVVLAVEAFNLLNARHEVEEEVLTGPRWRRPTAVQPPRVVRISIRATFD